MCCRLSVEPLDPQLAVLILSIGLFRPYYWKPDRDYAINWERRIEEEGTAVTATLDDGKLTLNLSPAISVAAHHDGKRLAAGVYFEIAAKYAEKCNGTITQHATVIGCKANDLPTSLLLAQYPAQPLRYERVCPGFQRVLMAGA